MNYDLNDIFRLATQLVNESSTNIFLTGKAGTGKTTFLKYISENCPKQMAVVAPTGVAAINAGGVTMHSFFHLPFSPFVPDVKGFHGHDNRATSKSNLLGRLRMTGEKRRILRELELLIIDEISMVRCDMLDAVDAVLRHVRRRHHEKFGGVQVLFIGDMFQLSPVIKEQEWELLKEFYSGPYFFDSHVLKDEHPVYVEFDKIYRQSDEQFIHLLNQVRNNCLDDNGRDLLKSRFLPDFKRSKDDGYIILTTHNEKARVKNESELNKLGSKMYSYSAEIERDFPEASYPAELDLRLKVGAQVMFIKNDSEKSKRYFNGKIGVVQELTEDKIFVQCKDDPEPIEVGKEKWENIRYSLDKSSQQINEEVMGSFTQYPLRLAWAITIHKSQGLTFDKVIIDAGDVFAPGQVYVALSRCTTLDGIVLQSRMRPKGIFTDERIVRFSGTNTSKNLLQQELERSRKIYQLKLLLSLFDYSQLLSELKAIDDYIREHASSFNDAGVKWLVLLMKEMETLQTVAEKFRLQLETLFTKEDPDSIRLRNERISAAVQYFLNSQSQLSAKLAGCPIVTDSREHAKETNESLKEVFTGLSIKKHLFTGFTGEFDPEAYHHRKKSFALPQFFVNVYAGATDQRKKTPHPQLYHQLRQLRDSICLKSDLPIYMVAGTNTLDEIATYLPQDLVELRKISGFGDAKIRKYGQQFLGVIQDYCKEKGLSSLIHEKVPKRERTSTSNNKKVADTKAESLKLYREGKSVEMIANARSLTTQTIQGHLAHYVSLGEIDIKELVSDEKVMLIEPALKSNPDNSLVAVKQKLGEEISFGEIRLVMASIKFQNS